MFTIIVIILHVFLKKKQFAFEAKVDAWNTKNANCNFTTDDLVLLRKSDQSCPNIIDGLM